MIAPFFPARASMQHPLARLLLVLVLLALLGGCTLPSLEGRLESLALDEAQSRDTSLGEGLAPSVDAHPGLSGIYPLDRPIDAFAARMVMAHAAERTLDVQYYIWHPDITGMLLFEALYEAAERGVRVRMLLDDSGTGGIDEELAALASHPNIQVRLFNPFVVRTPKWIGYLTDFSRANRRMHNKSFTADNQASIIGGRNIGDAYFGAARDVTFSDLDVLAVGEVVDDVSSDFDRYWSSGSSYPATRILPSVGPEGRVRLEQAFAEVVRDPEADAYLTSVSETEIVQKLLANELGLVWAPVRMLSDDPSKGLGEASGRALLSHDLELIFADAERKVALVSPYFVPAEAGTEAFRRLERDGVEVEVLTNALEATDVAAVHAGYAKRRKALLEAGVELYELRRGASKQGRNPSAGPFGSSGASLHAKTFAVDGERIFVGSFNFDPRSANLNTELGFIIEDPSLARQIDVAFDERVPLNAYEVRLDPDGELYWLERRDGQVIRHDVEPNSGLFRRMIVSVVALLPVDWLL
ncbi:phospholipase D family protein [Halomonas saccharevitans]|uniref:Phosphatidylserine/phosphatidylglycerophosphate/cardiolipin synthase n=1 Tax=Halomonas saccharevitans TaxID=416872 RepID=A0A1I7CEQ3_9GAMM|nr:phospholipase D family protein [Halomonas saccharevitans]SFT97907.1 Phosphatidylserine/phosphatidylglycerophosphate/cardiolipin synthase [Halomonas saccharevitans]